ncbi:MAG: nucleotide exchange factor GrpE [Parcubacteria group bacterium]|nr:nucleotide exchange factor GrpE [Parcubacteria group bacterium]
MTEDIEKLKEELEKVKKERDEYLAGWQRAKADFINYQKDEAKRAEIISKFAAESLIADFVLILDSFDLAQTQAHEEESKNIRIIRDQALSILKKWGLEEIPASPGDQFDPNFHEAVERSSEEGKPEGTIIEVLERGYLLHSKVLRPAKVKVS